MNLNCFGGHSRRQRRTRSSSLDLLCGRLDRGRDPDQGQAIFYSQLRYLPDGSSQWVKSLERDADVSGTSLQRNKDMLVNRRRRKSVNSLLELAHLPASGRNVKQASKEDPLWTNNHGPGNHSDVTSQNNREDLKIGVALCDNNPSPYDREGLPFKVGDKIQILAMNPSGMWRGRVNGREGTFKFIHVKLLHNQPRRHSTGHASIERDDCDMKTVLSVSHLEYLAPLLILNGYDSVADVLALTEEDLEYLGMSRDEQLRILEAASLLHPESSTQWTDNHLPDLVQPHQSRAGARREKNSRPSVYSRLSWHPNYSRLLDRGEQPRRRPLSADVGSQLSKKLHGGKRKSQPAFLGFGLPVIKDGVASPRI